MITVDRIEIDKVKLTNLIRTLPGKTKDILDALAFEGEAYVKRSFGASPSAPGDPPGVDTGALRSSIHTEKTAEYERAIVTGVDYAVFLEFGTVKMAARPFMLPMALYLRTRIEPMFKRFAG